MIKVGKPGQLLNPPGWPLLAGGIAAGLVSGLLALPVSAETATAVGLAWLIGVALGGWLGLAAARGIIIGFRLIYKRQSAPAAAALAAAQSRLTALQARRDGRSPAADSVNGHSPPSRRQSPVYSDAVRLLWRCSWNFLPVGISGIFILGLATILFYAGGLDFSLPLLGLAGSAAITCPALAFAWIFPLVLNRKIRQDSRRAIDEIDRMEQSLAAANAEPPAIFLPDVAAIAKAMDTPSRWLPGLAAPGKELAGAAPAAGRKIDQ